MAAPLAQRIRPECLEDIAGQSHLLAPGRALYNIMQSGKLPNLIFYGPSGVGKTTVANIIAKSANKALFRLNGTVCSSADIREIIAQRDTLEGAGGVVLYLDEIQYLNKKQQQILLEFIENGDVTLIAATTENPYFYVYNAILSRCTVFEFKALTPQEIIPAVKRAVKLAGEDKIAITDEAANAIVNGCGGDVRKAVNAVELCVLSCVGSARTQITEDIAKEVTQKSSLRYDRDGDGHYDVVSAYQKSMRGSDTDAALHYLARLLEAGDLPSACRRLLVCANEDVGLAYPMIIPIVKAAVDTALQVGLPEARIPLANAVVLVCQSPKSNSAYMAINTAMADVQKGDIGDVPRGLQNKHYDGEDAEIKGQNYLYPHDYPGHWVKQEYLPKRLKDIKYYFYGDNATERKFKEYWDKIKTED